MTPPDFSPFHLFPALEGELPAAVVDVGGVSPLIHIEPRISVRV